MIYELRIYDAVPGKLQNLHDRFQNVTLEYFDKYRMRVIGFWVDEVGENNKLTYMLAFDDMKHRDEAWDAFRSDEERLKIFAKTEENGPIVLKIRNSILRPTPYSPIV